ncbi:MAG: hypothetical protein AAGJ18_15335 [Bacteroidota bacterium]
MENRNYQTFIFNFHHKGMEFKEHIKFIFKRRFNKSIYIAIFCLIYSSLIAQDKEDISVLTLNFSYGLHLPAGDLKDRFGNNFSLGGGLDFFTKKNFIVGIKGNNLFGSTVKEDVLASLRDKDGFIIGGIGAGQAGYSDVLLRQRGLYLGGHVGKLIPISSNETKSGIRLTLGAGLLQHKVRIQDESGTADQLKGELIKGYDQLTNGLALEQFVGYQQMNRKTGVNFFAGFELTEAFTQNRRSINFTTQQRDSTKRLDVLVGVRVGWSFTFYTGRDAEEIQY